MHTRHILTAIALAAALAGCSREPERDRSDSAAREAGRVAHDVVKETREAAKKAGKEIREAAREAREGWKEAAREDRSKPDKK